MFRALISVQKKEQKKNKEQKKSKNTNYHSCDQVLGLGMHDMHKTLIFIRLNILTGVTFGKG